MKPIKWRARGGIRRATVDGVELRRHSFALSVLLHAELPSDAERKHVEFGLLHLNRQQIDAAAYALADLVQTLKGME